MSENRLILSILVPLSIATFLSVVLCTAMICCFINKRKRRQQIADSLQSIASQRDVDLDDVERMEIMSRLDFENQVNEYNIPTAQLRIRSQDEQAKNMPNHFRVENKPMYITETMGGGSSRRDSLKMSLSTIFSSIGDLLPSNTDKHDETTTSTQIDDVFTPSLTNIHQKLGEMREGSKRYYTLTWTTPDFSLHDETNQSIPASSAGSSIRQQLSHPVHRIRALRSSGSTNSRPRGSNNLSSVATPPIKPIRIASHSDSGGSPLPTKRVGLHGSQASTDRHSRISSAAAELSNILEASPRHVLNDLSVFETPENTEAYCPNPNTPVSIEDGSQTTHTTSKQYSNQSDSSYKPPHNTPNEQNDGNDNQYMMRAVWSSRASRELQMDDPTLQYINHITEHSLHSLDELAHEQAKLRKGSDLYSPTGRHHSTTSNNNNSLSLHTTDLNYSTAAVPIHCSTLDGFGMGDERPADRPESLQRPATIEESESVDFGTMKTSPESIAPSNQSDGYIYDLETMKARPTRNIDESKVQNCSSTLAPSESQWYYNQAYADASEIPSADSKAGRRVRQPQRISEFYHADESSSGCIRGGYLSNQNIIPSGQTSMNPQVGSRDTSSHPSDVYDPLCAQESGTVTDTTTSDQPIKSRDTDRYAMRSRLSTEQPVTTQKLINQSLRARPNSTVIPEVPVNSPQTLVTADLTQVTSSQATNSQATTPQATTSQATTGKSQKEDNLAMQPIKRFPSFGQQAMHAVQYIKPQTLKRFPSIQMDRSNDYQTTPPSGRSRHLPLKKSIVQQILPQSNRKQINQPLLSPNVYWV